MQFLSENRLNACQIFGRFNFVKTESKPTFGFLHIPSFHVSARPDWHYVLNLFTCSSVTKFLNMTLWKHMNGVWCKSVHEWSTRKQCWCTGGQSSRWRHQSTSTLIGQSFHGYEMLLLCIQWVNINRHQWSIFSLLLLLLVRVSWTITGQQRNRV